MKKVLVTGATGFLGRHVVRYLKTINHLSVITTSIESYEAVKAYDWIEGTKYVSANLYEPQSDWYDRLGQPDSIIHLAWAGLPNYKDDFHFTTNLYHDYHLLKQMIMSGVKSITVTGTCFEYGMAEGCLKEDMCPKPGNPYAIAKDTLRKMIEMLKAKVDFSFKWPRLFYLYGEGQNPNAILSQLKRALDNQDEVFNMSGGEQIRDYQPVEVMASNIVKIALQDEIQGVINNCSGEGIKVIDLVNNFLKAQQGAIKLNTGYYPYPDFEPFQFWGDDTKLKQALKAYDHAN